MKFDPNERLQAAKETMNAGDYVEAINLLSDILAITPQESELYIEALVCIGEVHWMRGRYDTAITKLETAKELGLQHGRMDLSGWALRIIGNVRFDQGFLDDAHDNYKRALGIFKETKEKKGIARCYNNLGVVSAERGEYDQALDYYNYALDMYKNLKDLSGESAVINNLGEIFRFRGEYADAEHLYLHSLKIDEELGDLYGQALCWGNLGAVSLGINDFEKQKKGPQRH